MDCSTARQWLDLHPPGSVAGEGDSIEVREHLSECALCREFAGDVREFDGRMAAMLAEVPVPEGLRERLLHQLSQSAPLVKATPPVRSGRWKVLAGLSLSLMLLISGAYWATRPVQFGIDQLGDSAATVLLGGKSQPESFQGSFSPRIEDPRWQRVVASEPIGWNLDGKPGHDAAAFRVTIPSLRFRGWLVMIPMSRVSDAPDSTEPVRLRYSQSVAWRDQKFVYVCLAEQGSVESLLDEWGAA